MKNSVLAFGSLQLDVRYFETLFWTFLNWYVESCTATFSKTNYSYFLKYSTVCSLGIRHLQLYWKCVPWGLKDKKLCAKSHVFPSVKQLSFSSLSSFFFLYFLCFILNVQISYWCYFFVLRFPSFALILLRSLLLSTFNSQIFSLCLIFSFFLSIGKNFCHVLSRVSPKDLVSSVSLEFVSSLFLILNKNRNLSFLRFF